MSQPVAEVVDGGGIRVAHRYAHLQRSMRDARSGKVVFVAHCLLNQNTRYLGGAVCPGVVAAAIGPYVEDGTGIVQLPCPEQRVWGGVLKTRLLWLLEHPRLARAGPVVARLATTYVARRYAELARAVVDEIEDYTNSGLTVTGLVGVAGSPSCGVSTTLDLPCALRAIGRCPRLPVTADWMNAVVVEPALRPGTGMFVEALSGELTRRGLAVPVSEYPLTSAGSVRRQPWSDVRRARE